MSTININNPESFATYPNGRMCAILEDVEKAGNSLDAMIAAGVNKEDIEIYFGKKGVDVIDADATKHGVLASIAKAFRAYGDEENKSMHIYEDALEKGEYVMSIKVEDTDEDKEKVRGILADHNAHSINYFGTWVVEGLKAA